jgi:DNA-binding NtrC family response regulator
VTGPGDTPAILVVDGDVGFLWWLGELFHESGYRSIPALNCRQALSMIKKMSGGVDLLVVNPALSGVSRLIQTLSRNRSPKIVLIPQGGVSELPGVNAVATLERPSGRAAISRSEWQQKVRAILSQVGFRAAS